MTFSADSRQTCVEFHGFQHTDQQLNSPFAKSHPPWLLLLCLSSFHTRHVNMAFSTISVRDSPKEIKAPFWNNSSEISQRSRQKGLQYAFESYIHNITCRWSIVNEEVPVQWPF